MEARLISPLFGLLSKEVMLYFWRSLCIAADCDGLIAKISEAVKEDMIVDVALDMLKSKGL